MASGAHVPAHSIHEDRKYDGMAAFTFTRNHTSDIQSLEHRLQLLHEEVHIEEKSESSMKHQKNR